jgi:DNA-binding transcriptional LysR family regulator
MISIEYIDREESAAVGNFTLDQILNFLAVVDRGSFSAASRARGRAQPAVTHSIQKLESQLGSRLFDRSDYRPVLTEAGRLLLPEARRIVEQVGVFSLKSRGIAAGLEQELAIVVDPICPVSYLTACLAPFQQLYPSVQLLLYTDVLDGVTRYLVDGTCKIGILSVYGDMPAALNRRPLLGMDIELLLVAAPHHPLAQISGPVGEHVLREHVQLALMDKWGVVGLRDYAILANRVWRLGDVMLMLAMLRAGLGYGIVPDHLVREDIVAGRLQRIRPQSWDVLGSIPLPIYAAWKADQPMGPAAQWLLDHLCHTP